MAEPRSRATRVPRKNPRCCTEGDALTCPRCGNPCHVLVPPYYESPWAEWVGLCCECCLDAMEHFEREGWPAPRVVPG